MRISIIHKKCWRHHNNPIIPYLESQIGLFVLGRQALPICLTQSRNCKAMASNRFPAFSPFRLVENEVPKIQNSSNSKWQILEDDGVMFSTTEGGPFGWLKYASTWLVRSAAEDFWATLIPLTFNQAAFSFIVHLSCGFACGGNTGRGGENSLSKRHRKIHGESMVKAR